MSWYIIWSQEKNTHRECWSHYSHIHIPYALICTPWEWEQSSPLLYFLVVMVPLSSLPPPHTGRRVRRCWVPATSCWPSRWRTGAGGRTLSHASNGATCRARTPRSTTPAGPCWAWWLPGNTKQPRVSDSWQRVGDDRLWRNAVLDCCQVIFCNLLFSECLCHHVLSAALMSEPSREELRFSWTSSCPMETGHRLVCLSQETLFLWVSLECWTSHSYVRNHL